MAVAFRKDPDARLDYAIDWSQWLEDGDAITAATWQLSTGITQATPEPSIDGGKTVIWLSGGTDGVSYPITCRVTTTQGRVDERTIVILVAQR